MLMRVFLPAKKRGFEHWKRITARPKSRKMHGMMVRGKLDLCRRMVKTWTGRVEFEAALESQRMKEREEMVEMAARKLGQSHALVEEQRAVLEVSILFGSLLNQIPLPCLEQCSTLSLSASRINL